MWPFFLVLLCGFPSTFSSDNKQNCGGLYTAARGILSTPNFPGPFKVPINCEWVIDAQLSSAANTSIVIYLTQLFVYEGLTFTEYQLYDSDYKINPKIIHRVNETNISRTRWIKTHQSYLVIQLKLTSLDSTHLRVLDKFLDVFGFNITYEITTGSVRSNPCTMMDCGFTGNCYDYYTKFSCLCLQGYTGPTCSNGSSSFCNPGNVQTCKNGGTCIHVGVAAVRCACTKNFTGPTCDLPVHTAVSKDCSRCRSCPSEERPGTQCKCFDKDKVNMSNNAPGDRPGFTTTMHLTNLPKLNDEETKLYLRQQIFWHLQTNSSYVEDVTINNIVHFRNGVDVTFHVSSPKREEKRLRSILNKWEDKGHVGNITISERDTYLRPQLSIQSLDINQFGLIREKDQFILSCVARGSPTIRFRWFKDGIFINVTATRKWVKLIKDPHFTDQYTGLLGIENAHAYDEGVFTCQVEDFGRKECLHKEVVVEKKPLIKIDPMSLTVKKGDNFTIKCVALEERKDGLKYIYSWTKNKELLPVRTDFERYEILYPSGSILQVKNAEKNVQYSCLVQSSKVSSERQVSVYVVDRKSVYTCPTGILLNMTWMETAPDTNSILNCPKGYTGVATRYCALKDGRRPAWEMPSFSECTHQQLKTIYDTFQRLKLGYVSTRLETLLNNVLLHVQKNTLLPGEGAKILNVVQDMVLYAASHKINSYELKNYTANLFSIVDKVLATPNSLSQQTEIRTAFEIVNKHIITSGASLLSLNSPFFHTSMTTIDINIVNLTFYQSNKYFHIPSNLNKSLTKWLGVQISGTNVLVEDISRERFAAGIIFRNITSFMPPRLFLRIKDGSELEYEIYSQIVTVFPLPEHFDMYPISIDFKHQLNHKINWSENEAWDIKCGYADMSTFTYSWDIYTCYTQVLGDMKTRCICPKFGIFTLLLTLAPKLNTENPGSNILVLIVGCVLGMVFTLSVTVALAVSCFLKQRSVITVLKLQCSSSVFVFEIVFVTAVLISPPQIYFMLFLAGLEASILLGISSHLSKLLIIFTELIALPSAMTSKQTVVGIISGVPVITVFASHLSYKTMDVKLESWWMLRGTLSFNIFLCVVSIMTVLFVFIYRIVVKKLNDLIEINEKYAKPLRERKRLLRRSCCIFVSLIVFSISSVIFINFPNQLWSIYQFSCINVLLGLIILICYILYSETTFQQIFFSKKTTDVYFGYNSPLKFITKQDQEDEKDCRARTRSESQQFTLTSRESAKTSIAAKSQSIAATFESCLQNNSTSDSHPDLAAASNRYKHPSSLEYYNSSPQNFRKHSNLSTICSPDILSNKVCVELDLVASSLQRQPNRINKFSSSIPPISPDEAITNILDHHKDQPDQPEISYKVRTQPDGHDESNTCEKALSTVEEVSETELESPEVTENPSPTNIELKSVVALSVDNSECANNSDSLDCMLDSISQDLEYLLNTTEEINISTLKRVSKGTVGLKQSMNKEENDENIPDSVTIRSKC